MSISAVVLGVFAEARRGLRRAQLGGLHAIRRAGLSKAVTRIGDERTARLKVVERFDVGAVGNWGVRNPERRREIADLVDGLALDPCVEFVGILVGLLGDRQRRLLVDPVLMSGHRAQVEPLLRGAAADVDQAVLGPRDARHGQPAGVAPRPAEHLVIGHRIVSEAEDLGLEHRQVDQLRGAPHPGGHRRHARVRACEVVADLTADVYRCPVGRSAAEANDPARPRLQRELGGRSVPPGAVQPERRDGRDRQMWVLAKDLSRRKRGVPGEFRAARPHHRISVGQQGVKEIDVVVGIGVDDHAALRAGQKAEQRTVVAGRDVGTGCRPSPQRIPFGRFDFDDVGAAVGKQLRAVGTGDPRRQIDDYVAVERLH